MQRVGGDVAVHGSAGTLGHEVANSSDDIVEALFDCLIAGGRFGQVHQADLIDGVKCFALAGSAAEDGHFGDVAIHLVLDIIAILALRMSATAKQCACRQQRTGE